MQKKKIVEVMFFQNQSVLIQVLYCLLVAEEFSLIKMYLSSD